MKLIPIRDDLFNRQPYTAQFKSKYLVWNRAETNADFCVYTDNHLKQASDDQVAVKVAWLLQPRSRNPALYDWVEANQQVFSKVLTFDGDLLTLSDRFAFYPMGGTRLSRPFGKGRKKTQLLSIQSIENEHSTGHLLRSRIHDLVASDSALDLTDESGSEDSLMRSAFSIAIEESRIDCYFTHQLIDAFLSRTIPLYWGCPSISDYFNPEGIIPFNHPADLEKKLKTLSFDVYASRKQVIDENYEKAKKYVLAEDWIYREYDLFNHKSLVGPKPDSTKNYSLAKTPIYIISLPGHESKYEALKKALVSKWKVPESRIERIEGVPDTPPILGCTKAHLKALKEGVKSNEPFLVLEDDVLLNEIGQYNKSLQLPTKTDCLYLGISRWAYNPAVTNLATLDHNKLGAIAGSVDYVKVRNMLSAHAIFYTNMQFVKKIIEVTESSVTVPGFPVSCYFDVRLAAMQESNQCLATKTPWFYQAGKHEYCTKFEFAV